jgi:hypothetical protein
MVQKHLKHCCPKQQELKKLGVNVPKILCADFGWYLSFSNGCIADIWYCPYCGEHLGKAVKCKD